MQHCFGKNTPELQCFLWASKFNRLSKYHNVPILDQFGRLGGAMDGPKLNVQIAAVQNVQNSPCGCIFCLLCYLSPPGMSIYVFKN